MFMPTVMPMPINQTGHEVIPGAFKYLGASRIFAVSNFDESALIDENIGSFQLAELRIHGENIRAGSAFGPWQIVSQLQRNRPKGGPQSLPPPDAENPCAIRDSLGFASQLEHIL